RGEIGRGRCIGIYAATAPAVLSLENFQRGYRPLAESWGRMRQRRQRAEDTGEEFMKTLGSYLRFNSGLFDWTLSVPVGAAALGSPYRRHRVARPPGHDRVA